MTEWRWFVSFFYLFAIFQKENNKILCVKKCIILTTKFFISQLKCRSRQVPSVFMLTASFKFASNFNVAATWNTTVTLSVSFFLLSVESPRSVFATSPLMGTIFFSNFGFSLQNVLNICKQINIEVTAGSVATTLSPANL